MLFFKVPPQNAVNDPETNAETLVAEFQVIEKYGSGVDRLSVPIFVVLTWADIELVMLG